MEYTIFGSTGYKVSKLGFGAMRLPTVENDDKKIVDEEESIRIIHRAIELGVNYFDTAPYYCDKMSEPVLGAALRTARQKALDGSWQRRPIYA